MHDLVTELVSATEAVRQSHIDRLLGMGVAPKAIAALGTRQTPFGVAAIEADRTGHYQPGDGSMHVIMPVMEAGEPVDLIAWHTTAPARWYWRTGLGWALGTEFLTPRWDNDPVPLLSTPLEWLIAAGQGLCILDWSAPEVRELANLEAIEADEMVGRRLLAVLSRPVRVPRMIYRKAVRHAA